MQLGAGAFGITCQKVSEAAAMVAGSPVIRDRRRKAYTSQGARPQGPSVGGRRQPRGDGWSLCHFENAAEPLAVLVEHDTGANRCGVGDPQAADALAAYLDAASGLAFGGLMTYPPPAGGEAAVQRYMREAKALIDARGLAVPVITSGGTPSMMRTANAPVVSEYRPGTYVYNERSLVSLGVCSWADCALTVLATVVSVPMENRAIIIAGSKALTSDLLGPQGHGHVLGHDDIAIDQLSGEHGRLLSSGPIGLAVGDKVRIVPAWSPTSLAPCFLPEPKANSPYPP